MWFDEPAGECWGLGGTCSAAVRARGVVLGRTCLPVRRHATFEELVI